ncbi:hypothetical protein ACE6H2_014073 [Prunus campanulata]
MGKENEESWNERKMRMRKLGERELVSETEEAGLKEGMEDKKTVFIKHHMARGINPAGDGIKATIPFLIDTIAKKNTGFAAEFQLVGRVRTEPWKASTSIDFEKGVVWFAME